MKWEKRVVNIVWKTIFFLFSFLVLLFLSIWLVLKVPSIQNYVVFKAIHFLSDKTNTKVTLERIDLEFPTSIVLKELYVEDTKKDTLLFLKEAEIAIHFWELLHKKVAIDFVALKGVNAKLKRGKVLPDFNFQFLIDAFVSKDKKSEEVDTASSTWQIEANEIRIAQSRFSFEDSLSGIFLHSSFQEVAINVNNLDLSKKDIGIENVKLLGIRVNLQRTTSYLPDTSSDKGNGWNEVTVKNLYAKNIQVDFEDVLQRTKIFVLLGKSSISSGNVNLTERSVSATAFSLVNTRSSVLLNKDSVGTAPAIVDTVVENVQEGWKIKVNKVLFANNSLKLDYGKKDSLIKGMDYNHLAIQGLNTEMKEVFFQGQTIRSNILSFSLQEKSSGFAITSLKTNFKMDSIHTELKGLDLNTPQSHLGHSISISYTSFDKLLSSLRLDCYLKESKVSIQEVLLFAPALTENRFLKKNNHRTIEFSLEAKGSLEKLRIKSLLVKTADSTRITLSGTLRHLNEVEKLTGDIQLEKGKTTLKDLQALLPDSLLPTTITFPSSMHLSGTYNGTISDFTTQIAFHSSDGDASLHAILNKLGSSMPVYEVNLSTFRYKVGRLIQQPSLGPLSSTIGLTGKGFNKDLAVADMKAKIQSIEFQQYAYKNLKVEGHIQESLANIIASIQDSNLSLRLNSQLGWKTGSEFCKADISLLGADLFRLGILKDQVQISATAALSVNGYSMDDIKGQTDIRNILVLKRGKEYRVDSLVVALENGKGQSKLDLQSPIVMANYAGNLNAFSVSPIVQQHIDRYFDIIPTTKAKQTFHHFAFEMSVNESALIEEVFLPSLTAYDKITVKGGFNSDSARLWANVDMPTIEYASMRIKGAQITLDSDKEKLQYGAKLTSFIKNGIQLEQTSLKGEAKNDQATIDLQVSDSTGKEKLLLQSLLARKGEIYHYSILPDGLKIQEKAWEVNNENYVEFGPKHLYVHQFKIGYKGQSIYANSTSNAQDANLDVRIEHFHLHTLSRIIEQNDSLFKGTVNGNVLFHEYQKNLAFTSDIKISHLSYKTSKIGDLLIKANNTQGSKYNLEASLNGMGNDVRLSAYYNPVKEGDALHASVDIGALQLSSLESFSLGQISHSSGALKGSFVMNGAVSNPTLDGTLSFQNIKTKVHYLNEFLQLENETVKISDKGMVFTSFTVKDTVGNTAKLNGSIDMESYKNVQFNLDLTTNDFLVLNTTAVQNKMYFGKVLVDSQIKLRGTPDLPKVNSTISIVKGSKFTFTVPESKLSVDKGEGIVVFLFDSSKVDPIMLRGSQTVSKLGALKGLDLNSHLKIDQFSTLKIIIDPISGDSLVVRGNADLDFGMDLSGKMSLAGTYILSDGTYKAYIEENLVTREFALVKDSKITWNGDPLDAYVDLSARYDVRTSARDLMTIGSPGAIITDSSLLMRSLLFNVYLIMQGELLKPQISFRLDMPEDERVTASGAIYAKINEVNQNQAELNKQVFALLVLSKFIPATAGGGSGTSASSFARSSVSKIMTDQLNQLSGRYLKGAQINVDVQSYNYSQNGRSQSNTQVNLGVKKDFNRFTVQVGSNIQLEGQQAAQQNNVQNFTGDIQVGYKLTEDGRYQAKAFRQNQVDGLVNGIITETGAGIMYHRDYNSLKDLLFSPKKKKK